MLTIVRMLHGTIYDQEGGTLTSNREKGEKSKSGFTEFFEKKKQVSLYRVQERRRHKYAGDLSNPP
jgi:hypothetical protein